MKRLSIFLVSLVLVLSTVGMVNATPVTYTDRTTWEAAIGAAPDIFVDFNGFVVDTDYASAPLDLGPFSMSVTGTPEVGRHMIDVAPFYLTGVDGTPYADFFVEGPLTATITFDTAVTAWGFDIFAAGNVYALEMDLLTSSGIQTVSLMEASSTTFFGVTMDPTETISSITFRNDANDGFSVDNIAAVTSARVPEPSTLLLLGSGLIGLGFIRRKFKA